MDVKVNSASQKRACLDILNRPVLSREATDVNNACHSSTACGEVHVSLAAASQTQPNMTNCQFSNCK